MTLTLAIDQGTHATRAVVFDADGRRLALGRAPVDLQRISQAEVEQSPEDILMSLIRQPTARPAWRPSAPVYLPGNAAAAGRCPPC
jgi:ribulose kinase